MPKDLLLDFGAVLIPIDQELSYDAFARLGAKNELADKSELFEQMERGELSADEFCQALRPYFFRKRSSKRIYVKHGTLYATPQFLKRIFVA